jgi:hypothetical protein
VLRGFGCLEQPAIGTEGIVDRGGERMFRRQAVVDEQHLDRTGPGEMGAERTVRPCRSLTVATTVEVQDHRIVPAHLTGARDDPDAVGVEGREADSLGDGQPLVSLLHPGAPFGQVDWWRSASHRRQDGGVVLAELVARHRTRTLAPLRSVAQYRIYDPVGLRVCSGAKSASACAVVPVES